MQVFTLFRIVFFAPTGVVGSMKKCTISKQNVSFHDSFDCDFAPEVFLLQTLQLILRCCCQAFGANLK